MRSFWLKTNFTNHHKWLVLALTALVTFNLCALPSAAQQRKATTTTRKAAPQKKTTQQKKPAAKKKTTTATQQKKPVTVSGLKAEQKKVQQQIKEQERLLRANEQDVKKRLQNLVVLNNEIADKRRSIDSTRRDISALNENIELLQVQMQTLEKELEERKARYTKSMRFLHRNRNIQSHLMFVFSARNFSQMYRRLRFVREYAAYQQTQGEAVMSMRQQVKEVYDELSVAKRQKNDLLARGEQQRKSLENKQTEQQNMVSSLQKQQKTIQGIIEQQKKQDAALNAQIDKLVAEEIARAKARAEAEARRKAAEAAAKKRAEELARKKAAAEAAARENARRIAEAKAKEEKAKAEARAAARKSAEEKARAERKAREAAQARQAAERKAAAEAKAHERDIAATSKKSSAPAYTTSSEDRLLNGSFESNRGRLPMPLAGGYRILNHYGTNHVTDVKGNVTLDKKGVDLQGQAGAAVRSVFGGEVTAVGGYLGSTIVIIRHGTYLSVYCNLASVSVKRGQKVTARQTIGTLGSDGVLQFQLRKGSATLNPLHWLSR